MNYKEAAVTGTEWVRSNRIIIVNEYNDAPVIHFNEESIAEVNGAVYKKALGTISDVFTDPLKEFTLLNPLDGTVIGTAKYMDLQVMLYSLYFNLATVRDNQITPE